MNKLKLLDETEKTILRAKQVEEENLKLESQLSHSPAYYEMFKRDEFRDFFKDCQAMSTKCDPLLKRKRRRNITEMSLDEYLRASKSTIPKKPRRYRDAIKNKDAKSRYLKRFKKYENAVERWRQAIKKAKIEGIS